MNAATMRMVRQRQALLEAKSIVRPSPVPEAAAIAAMLEFDGDGYTLDDVLSETLMPLGGREPVTDAEADASLKALAKEFDAKHLREIAQAAETTVIGSVTGALGLSALVAASARQTRKASPIVDVLPNSPGFQRGRDDIPTVIVLSAPGSAELIAGHPAAGQTERNLNAKLSELNAIDPVKYPSTNCRDYRIVNSVEKVHYKAVTGRTEGIDAEVRAPDNLSRVRLAMAEKTNALVLGDKARLAVDTAGFDGSQKRGAHPSLQSINRKYKSDAGTPAERSADRIRAAVGDMTDVPARDDARAGGSGGRVGGMIHELSPVIRGVAVGSLRVGLKQGLGALLADLAVTLFHEVKAHLASADDARSLAVRLRCACGDVLSRWAEFVRTSLSAGLRSALSSLVDLLVNAVLSTAKRVLRMIREGASSLFQAFRMLMDPPPGMTSGDALHEASKLLLAGAATTAGVLVEEAIARALMGFPFADVIVSVALGLTTGLATVLLCHALDRLDLFGAVARRRDGHVRARLLEDATEAARATDDGMAGFLAVHGEYLAS